MEKISIIIPVYNAQKTLQNCLESIFSQTHNNFEIIAVNDGSTDKSGKILKKYNNKIIIIEQKNQGAPSARNAGAKLANSPYIIFCDADIIMKPNMLENLYSALQTNPQASYSYCNFKFGFKKFKLFSFDAEKLKKMPYIHTTSLIRKKHFLGFDQKLNKFQDWDLWLTMLENGHKGVWIDKILFKVKSGGTMSSWLPSFAYKLPWLKKVKKYKQAEKIIKEKHNL